MSETHMIHLAVVHYTQQSNHSIHHKTRHSCLSCANYMVTSWFGVTYVTLVFAMRDLIGHNCDCQFADTIRQY